MIGIIGAMQPEVDLLKENMYIECVENICGIEFHIGKISQKEIILTKCGIGKVNAAMAATILINNFGCDFIINTGIAGGINDVNTRDIIIGSKLMYHDFDCSIFGYDLGQVPGMPKYFCPSVDSVVFFKKTLKELGFNYKEATIYSGDIFVDNKDCLFRVDLNKTCITEMEGAAIAHVCVRSGVDFMVLRYISDVVGAENQVNDFNEFEEEMAKRSCEICLEILKKM